MAEPTANGNKTKARLKDDIRFVIFIFSFVAVALMWAVRLEGHVQALDVEVHEKGTSMRSDINGMAKQLNRIEKNQIILLHDAGLEPTKE